MAARKKQVKRKAVRKARAPKPQGVKMAVALDPDNEFSRAYHQTELAQYRLDDSLARLARAFYTRQTAESAQDLDPCRKTQEAVNSAKQRETMAIEELLGTLGFYVESEEKLEKVSPRYTEPSPASRLRHALRAVARRFPVELQS